MWNKNEPSSNIWRTRDVAEMAAALKTAPIFIDEIKSNFHNFMKVLLCFKFIGFILIIEILEKVLILGIVFLLHLFYRLYLIF